MAQTDEPPLGGGINPDGGAEELAISINSVNATLTELKPYLRDTDRATRTLRWVRPLAVIVALLTMISIGAGAYWYIDDHREDAALEENARDLFDFSEEQRIIGCQRTNRGNLDVNRKLEIYTETLAEISGADPLVLQQFLEDLNKKIENEFPPRDCEEEAERRQEELRRQGIETTVNYSDDLLTESSMVPLDGEA